MSYSILVSSVTILYNKINEWQSKKQIYIVFSVKKNVFSYIFLIVKELQPYSNHLNT